MKREILLRHKFVESVPDVLEDGVVYVSIEYTTAIHKCCCGCEREVVTPLTPTDWKLIFDGKTISLHPSIGSWALPCRSHYWIRNNRVLWAENWSQDKIMSERVLNAERKTSYFNAEMVTPPVAAKAIPSRLGMGQAKTTRWQRFKRLFRGK